MVGGTTGSCDLDGKHEAGEPCENGPAIGCAEAANGVCTVEPHWRCRQNLLAAPGPSICTPNCGDNFVFTAQGEACDDGGTNSNDGCSATCTVEPGWTCSIVNNRSVCVATACGDGFKAGLEACDTGVLNSDEVADRCRSNCTFDRCGDGIEDNVAPDEVCDDGVFNGLPGACNTTCTGLMPAQITNTPHAMADAPAGTVGLFLFDSYLLSVCIDLSPTDFIVRDNWLEAHDFLAGRVVTTNADMVVNHPLLILDAPDSDPMFTTLNSDVEPLYGQYFVPLGSTVFVGIAGGGPPLGCCGSIRGTCTRDPIDVGPGKGPCPDKVHENGAPDVGISCAPFDVATSRPWSVPGGIPVDPSQSPNINASCGSGCWTAGGLPCNNPPPPPPPGVHVECAPSDVDVSRLCQVTNGAQGCPGLPSAARSTATLPPASTPATSS